jgi:hypothetical protein
MSLANRVDHTGCISMEEPVWGDVIELVAAASACWYLEAKICATPVSMLVDTGSAYTLLSMECFNRIPELQRSSLKASNKCLRTANGGFVTVHGVTEASIVINGLVCTNPVIIADLGGISAVLGSDFMETYGVVFDVARGVVTILEMEVELYRRDNRDHCALVHTVGDITMESGEFIYLEGYAQCLEDWSGGSDPLNGDWLLEPMESTLGSMGLIMAESMVPRSATVLPILLFNPGSEPVEVEAGTVVGHIQKVEAMEAPTVASVLGELSVPAEVEDKPKGIVPGHLQPLLDALPEELSAEQRHLVMDLLVNYEDIFVGPDRALGCTSMAEHTIDTGSARPIRQPPRRAPIAQREIIEIEIQKMLDEEVIEPSNSPWAAPIVLVKKKMGAPGSASIFGALTR